MLADFLADNTPAVIGACLTIIGGLVHLVIAVTRLTTSVEFIKDRMDSMGKDSTTNRDSIREKVERLEQRMNGVDVALAKCQGVQASGH